MVLVIDINCFYKADRMKKSYRNKSNKRNGGGPFPLSYYNPGAAEPAASAGHDLLKAIAPIGVRPKIGGRRTKKRHTRRHRKTRGGFVPSIMDGFAAAASKYIVPVALFAGYKLMTRKGKRTGRSRRHTRRH
jgi:hypothetical protein